MAGLDLKISELNTLPIAADADLLAIVDDSNSQIKKIATSAFFSGRIPGKATSAQVRTGTDTSAYIHSKALSDAGIVKISAATYAVAGKVELATAAEVTTGDDVSRVIPPKSLADSTIFGQKAVGIQVLQGNTVLTSGDGKAYFRVPPQLNGMNIVSAAIQVITKSTTGIPTVQVARGRQGSATADFTYSDVFSTKLTIDQDEYDSRYGAAGAVINTSNDDLVTGDVLRVDVDVAGGGATGLNINIICQLP